MTSLTVLHINTEPGWRGGEAQTLMLARGLRRRGHANILALRAGGGLEAKARAEGFEVWARPLRGEADPGAILGLAGLMRRARPDILHCHTAHAVTLGTLAGLLARRPGRRIPAVLTRRVSFPLRSGALSRLKYTFRIDHIIAVAEEIRGVLLAVGIPPDRVSVVHSGLDLSRFPDGADPGGAAAAREAARARLGLPRDGEIVGAIGALVAHKGHAGLLEAAARLGPRRPGLRVVLVGDGPLRGPLEQRAQAPDLEGRVRFAGFREDVPGILPAFDLLALPSLSGEGSPAVLKEAMAAGVPVVASRLDGVLEIARADREALVVPAGDAPALAAGIDALLSDQALREGIAARARERVGEFSAERMVARTEEIYARVLGHPRPEAGRAP